MEKLTKFLIFCSPDAICGNLNPGISNFNRLSRVMGCRSTHRLYIVSSLSGCSEGSDGASESGALDMFTGGSW
jgi:hypothetical protein